MPATYQECLASNNDVDYYKSAKKKKSTKATVKR
jgi:hypothetical protein